MNNNNILWIIGLIILGFIIKIYNNIISKKNAIENSFSDIQVQLKMRYDLVTNLMQIVKSYATHEKSTLEKVVALRSSFWNITWVQDLKNIDKNITAWISWIFAIAENYPHLKADKNFLLLQNQLQEIEENIAWSRRYYNATLKEYNNSIQMFPNSILANIFGFKENKNYFDIDEKESFATKIEI